MKFKTNYDNCGYEDKEVIKGESLTRPDTYEPLDHLINRLVRTGGFPETVIDDVQVSFEDDDFDEYDDKIDVIQEGLEAQERIKAYNEGMSKKPVSSPSAEQNRADLNKTSDVSGEVKPDTNGENSVSD